MTAHGSGFGAAAMVSVTFHFAAQFEYDDALAWYTERDTTLPRTGSSRKSVP